MTPLNSKTLKAWALIFVAGVFCACLGIANKNLFLAAEFFVGAATGFAFRGLF